jgi:hypothetical protein
MFGLWRKAVQNRPILKPKLRMLFGLRWSRTVRHQVVLRSANRMEGVEHQVLPQKGAGRAHSILQQVTPDGIMGSSGCN